MDLKSIAIMIKSLEIIKKLEEEDLTRQVQIECTCCPIHPRYYPEIGSGLKSGLKSGVDWNFVGGDNNAIYGSD